MPISKERLTVFTNHPSETKDQALEETFSPYSTRCFQLVGVTIEDTIARHDVVKANS